MTSVYGECPRADARGRRRRKLVVSVRAAHFLGELAVLRQAISLILLLALLTSCARYHRPQSGVEVSYVSEEAEVGAQIHRHILERFDVNSNANLNAYVRSVGEKMLPFTDRKDLNYRFVILNDDRIYSTHVPGGYIYVTVGLFRFLTSEIELAGILAHEVGALQYRDPNWSKTKKVFDQLLRTGHYIGPAFGGIGVLSLMGLYLVSQVLVGEASIEKQLLKADEIALGYMVKSGYDPQGLIDPLRRMLDPTSKFRPYLYDYLQSHPVGPERLARIEEHFRELPLENTEFDSGRDAYWNATHSVLSARI